MSEEHEKFILAIMKIPQNLREFEATLKNEHPPSHWKPQLQALWWDAKGDWNRAHDCVDSLSGQQASWVHAYLHRKEGDFWNADYWYGRAGKRRPSKPLQEEFTDLLTQIL
ncbi:hypothetical protein [Muriicola marianensis]|uniref:Uncharacterized protein n=1 Tax=Muriicola marianensis TaxID=1324801 RepID=A0ABQ1QQT7_9FLAO|nr:hypothetical protein [Muriicola marianensis]GGD37210.1 hypothetical protein GCM10011361_00330 [Muriicola marianensis]